jgi:hypothetical protein
LKGFTEDLTMVTIEKIKRAYKIEESKHALHNNLVKYYIETEEEFIKGIESLLNTIGEENIIAVQFLNGKENEINGCIITCKE